MKKGLLDISVRCALLMALALIGQAVAPAQQAGASLTTTAPAVDGNNSSAPRSSSDQYRIGPRDVLSVRVSAGRPVPELSMESVEVDECGRIPLPSVQYEERNEIQAAGRTRTELAEDLRTFFLKYKRNPQVIVTIKEYNSQPVAINGAVVKPGQFQMRRPVQLLELVQFYAGGPTERAGGQIQVARLSGFQMCRGAVASPPASIEFLVFNLKETLSGAEASNPYLQPGDVVTLPEAKEAYVIGNVVRPGAVVLKDDVTTISKAIAMAGGFLPDSKKDKVRLVRQDAASGTRKEMIVDYQAISTQKAPDIPLQPSDIVEVQVSGGKRILRSLAGAIVPSVAQLPVRVIP